MGGHEYHCQKALYYCLVDKPLNFNEILSHCSFQCAGVAVPSAVERKELLQFPVVKEVASKL